MRKLPAAYMEIHQTNQFVVIVKKRDLLALCRSSFWICNSFFSDLQGTNQFASEFMKLFVGKRVIQLMSNDGRGKNWLFQYDTRIKTSKSWWKRKSVFCEHVVCLVLGVPGWLLCEGSPQQQHRRSLLSGNPSKQTVFKWRRSSDWLIFIPLHILNF